MTVFFFLYSFSWISVCIVAGILIIKKRSHLEIFTRQYWNLLNKPWKISTFLIATICMGAIAPYSGDPTWDYFDSTFMCIFAYLTAPWAVGTIYLRIRRKTTWANTYIAFCVWMFTASWSYDLYILITTKSYPITWLLNIFASSVLYIWAGLMWSLEWYKGRGVVFSFMQPNWPQNVEQHSPASVFFYALPIAILVIFLTGQFIF